MSLTRSINTRRKRRKKKWTYAHDDRVTRKMMSSTSTHAALVLLRCDQEGIFAAVKREHAPTKTACSRGREDSKDSARKHRDTGGPVQPQNINIASTHDGRHRNRSTRRRTAMMTTSDTQLRRQAGRQAGRGGGRQQETVQHHSQNDHHTVSHIISRLMYPAIYRNEHTRTHCNDAITLKINSSE